MTLLAKPSAAESPCKILLVLYRGRKTKDTAEYNAVKIKVGTLFATKYASVMLLAPKYPEMTTSLPKAIILPEIARTIISNPEESKDFVFKLASHQFHFGAVYELH